jgi:mono/diheme cytochrome c family protein
MMRFLALALASAVIGAAQQPRRPASPVSGEALYRTYCASCHGKTGTGDGPVAKALKTRPADLTRLAETHGGKFPEEHIFQVIEGEVGIAAHGEREMPVWGAVFRRTGADDAGVKLRIRNLVRYLAALQRK